MLLGCVLKCNFLREAFALGVFAHDVREASDWVEGGRNAIEVEFGDGLQGVDDAVQVGCHLDKLIVGEPDARVSGDIAHVAFGKMLGHESVLSCISPK